MEQKTTDHALVVARGGALAGLTPQSLEEVIKLADLMAKSEIVPKEYRDKPANILVAIQLGLEVGLAPMQALQSIAVVNGKPAMYGDAPLALVRASGLLEWIEEKGDAKEALCRVKRKGDPSVYEGRFSIADAARIKVDQWSDGQKRSSPLAEKDTYRNYPERMLKFRARGYALRDAFGDVLKGLRIGEEVEDYPTEAREPRNVTPAPTQDELMPKRASETAPKAGPAPAPAESSTAKTAETRVRFKLGKVEVETAGMTEAQMRRSIELVKKVDEKHGAGAAERCLNDTCKVGSRKELTEAAAGEYLDALEKLLAAPQREPGQEG